MDITVYDIKEYNENVSCHFDIIIQSLLVWNSLRLSPIDIEFIFNYNDFPKYQK